MFAQGFIFTVFLASFVDAYSTGPGSCDSPTAVGGPHESNSSQPVEGAYEVVIGGTALVEGKPFGVQADEAYPIELRVAPDQDDSFFRGFLIRLSAGEDDTSALLTSVSQDVQSSTFCEVFGVGNLAHNGPSEKTSIEGELLISGFGPQPAQAGVELLMEVTVVKSNREISEWYYSNYTLSLTDDAPTTPAPISTTTAPVTSAPSEAPTKSPTKATEAPVAAQTEPPTESPITEAPTKSPTKGQTGAPTDQPSATSSGTSIPTTTDVPSEAPSSLSSTTSAPTVAPTVALTLTGSPGPSESGSPVPASGSPNPSESTSPSPSPSKGDDDDDMPTLAPETQPPTDPTPSPTTSSGLTPFLPVRMSDNMCSPTNKCTLCEGDCDFDDDCEGNLVCFQKGSAELVPSCVNGLGSQLDGSRTDWCIEQSSIPPPPPAPISTPVPFMKLRVEGNSCAESKCNRCEGDCQTDGDCKPGLVCYQQDGEESVPGCINGEGTDIDNSRTDWCIPKELRDNPTQLAPPAPAPPGPSTDGAVQMLPVRTSDNMCSPDNKCGQCEGDCQTSGDCMPGLVCFQKGADEHVPGCVNGLGSSFDRSRTDWCIPPESANRLRRLRLRKSLWGWW